MTGANLFIEFVIFNGSWKFGWVNYFSDNKFLRGGDFCVNGFIL